ncbi:hypothetical protein JTB14_003119 [Gonioctena quinquepunctata]|nr:hypothetical protein JTB14_003119 [Gonioctena quinquepunctata]
MEELIAQIKGDYKPDQKTVKARLVEKYGDDILFTFQKKTVICLKNMGGKILNDAFYQQMSFIYKKFRYRKLLDVLSLLGSCSTYVGAVRFEISSTLKTESELCAEGFIQFIYDNANFNTQTIDGYNTFHVMGGMYTVGPASAVPPDATIARLTKIPAAEVIERSGHLTLKHFEAKQGGDGLKEIKIQDLSSKFQTEDAVVVSCLDTSITQNAPTCISRI